MESIVQALLSIAKSIRGGTDRTGFIQIWPSNTIPVGYLLLDGSAVSRTTYAPLFAILSTTFGVGDGSTTFNLPNYQNRVIVGKGTGTFSTLGSTGGAETHTLDITQIPAHTHTIPRIPDGGAATSFVAGSNSGGNTAANTGSQGGGLAHNNLQPYIVGGNWIIKT